jgi:energy-coupling factor transporter ATP-binding protein EcfA2
MNPALLLADEPTGNLDSRSADEVFALLRQFNREQGTAVLFVTHNEKLSARCDRIIRVVDGRVVDGRVVDGRVVDGRVIDRQGHGRALTPIEARLCFDPSPSLPRTPMTPESIDVLIVGAGISGIAAARRLQRRHPQRRYAILERRGGHRAAPGTCSATRACARTRTCTPWASAFEALG